MSIQIILGLVLVLLLAMAAGLFVKTKSSSRLGEYKRRKLMTDNEREFFERLVKALPDHHVFPQVAMSALLDPSSRDKRQAHGDRLRIGQQRVDYVICDLRCEIVAIVELDDKMHSRDKDRIRDRRTNQAGIQTIRFESKNKPAIEAIRAALVPAGEARPAQANG